MNAIFHHMIQHVMTFLQGLASGELRREELDFRDFPYELLITLKAVKPEAFQP